MRFELFWMVLTSASLCGLKIDEINVPNVYVKSDLQEKIYMKIPQNMQFAFGKQNMVFKLNFFLNKLKQSGRKWNQKIIKLFIHIEFRLLVFDSCIFINHNFYIMIVLYVNNIFLLFKFQISIKKMKKHIS